MQKKVLPVVMIIVCMLQFVSAQEVSEKKELAVFSLSYYGWDVPKGVLGAVDDAIKDVFVNLGRFEVIGMAYRLEEDDVSAFIDQIKKVKEESIEIPEGVRLGEETFTEADFNRLTGSFIIVIPTLSFFRADYDDDEEEYEAEIQTSFTFLNIETYETIAQFSVSTIGTGDSDLEAAKEAADYIPMQLAFEIKSVEEFQLKTGVLEITGNRILFELGKDMGVKVGDEFSIVNPRMLATGHVITEEIGLVEVTEVMDTVSYGRVVYSAPRPVIGDQLSEIPRFGAESEAYFHIAQTNLGYVLMPGVRGIVTRGFRRFRPVVGVEVPLNQNREIVTFGLPVTMYVGGELNWSFWRLQLLPSLNLGVSGIIPVWEMDEEDPQFVLSHFGGSANVAISYLISRDIRIQVDAGATFYASVFINSRSYFGPYGGIAAKIKL